MRIEKTINSPYVHLSVEDCMFEITGNSFSDDLSEIFEQIIEWVENEMPKITCDIQCKFNFFVFNSVTYKNILLLMSKFYELKEQGKSISVEWIYDGEDEDSFEVGEDLKDIFDIPVTIIKTKN